MKRLDLMSLRDTRKVCLRAYSDFGKKGCAARLCFETKVMKINDIEI